MHAGNLPVCQLSAAILQMDERAQRRNALLVAVFSVLVTAASFYTGRSAVLLAGAP
jgi:hypothetical protein